MITGRVKAAGYTQLFDPAVGHNIEQETRQCIHCGKHWVYQPGSGQVNTRGFCLKCFGMTCGSVECDQCIPFEKWLERQER